MALIDGLVSYWKLDEANSVRADRIGSNNLTPVSTVGAVVGKRGRGAQVLLADAGSYLECAVPSGLQFTGSYTLAFWSYIYSLPDVQHYHDHFNYFTAVWDQPKRGFMAKAAFNNDMAWITGWGDSWLITHAPFAINQWTLFVFWADADNRIIDAVSSYDGFSSHETAASEGMAITACENSTPLWVGGLDNDFGYGDQIIDEIGVWNRVLTTDERTAIYNGGDGWTYSKPVALRKAA